ncbi:hypothetical protein LPJ72_004715 [Coemansia sp. Benny D160-2]|nr:hypothetical protein LPJ72_004715 [Coemansia sp. Benny D160-2]
MTVVTDFVLLDFENAEVRSSDFESLKPEGWLTGEIINFYWTFLERREFHTEPSVLFLGTYTTYRISNAENATVTDNISAQLSDQLNHRQMVLIPLNHRNHWSLLVYCRLTRTFYHYDSISKHNRNFAERAAGKFLRVLEPALKDGFYFKSMQTPQQNNDYDCGIYVLAIAEELARRFINNKKKQLATAGNSSSSSRRSVPTDSLPPQSAATTTTTTTTAAARRSPRDRRHNGRRDDHVRTGISTNTSTGNNNINSSRASAQERYRSAYDKHSGARDFSHNDTSAAAPRNHNTLKPSMMTGVAASVSSQKRNQSTPPVARVSATTSSSPRPSFPPSTNSYNNAQTRSSPSPPAPRRALTSDLLMPKFTQAFSGFQTPFAAMYRRSSSEFHMPEPLLKGGGNDILSLDAQQQQNDDDSTLTGGGSGVSSSGGRSSRDERLRLETRLMEKAGLPRDFWLVTVEDIEYPHCMRRRIRALVLELQEQQQGGRKDRRRGDRIHY